MAEQGSVVNKSTGIALGVVIVLLGATVAITKVVTAPDSEISELTKVVTDLRWEIKDLRGDMAAQMSDRFRGTQMKLYNSEIGRLNPDLKTPDISSILSAD